MTLCPTPLINPLNSLYASETGYQRRRSPVAWAASLQFRADEFRHLYGLDDEALARHGAGRMTVDAKPGYPCRVTLEDAEPGESVLLVNYEHLPVNTPYRSAHAVFVREGATTSAPISNRIPEQLKIRLLSIRAIGGDGMLIDADVVHGEESEPVIRRLLDDPRVDYLHVHNAKPGCYAARVDRF